MGDEQILVRSAVGLMYKGAIRSRQNGNPGLRRLIMAQLPEAFGMTITVEDVEAARRFYTDLYQPDHVSEKEYAGLTYTTVMRDGEVLVNIFPKVEGNPLADVVPALKVDSVAAYMEKVKESGATALIPPDSCPSNGAAFAIFVDPSGNQILIREPKRS